MSIVQLPKHFDGVVGPIRHTSAHFRTLALLETDLFALQSLAFRGRDFLRKRHEVCTFYPSWPSDAEHRTRAHFKPR